MKNDLAYGMEQRPRDIRKYICLKMLVYLKYFFPLTNWLVNLLDVLSKSERDLIKSPCSVSLANLR